MKNKVDKKRMEEIEDAKKQKKREEQKIQEHLDLLYQSLVVRFADTIADKVVERLIKMNIIEINIDDNKD